MRRLAALLLLSASVPAFAAGPCVFYGDKPDALPDGSLPPLERTCRLDPLQDPAALKAAFQTLVERVRSEDRRDPVLASDPSGDRPLYELAIGRGEVRPERIDAASHWGDIAILYLRKNDAGGYDTLGARLVTIRAERTPRTNDLDAKRVEFDLGPAGELRSVQVYSGLRMEDAPRMSWLGPTDSPNRDEDLRGWWTIRAHQLLQSWAPAE